MISRYNSLEISDIWCEENKFKTYLKVELALLKALEGSLIPEGVTQNFEQSLKVDVNRIKEIEKETRHDVIAFCTSITEQVPSEFGKYFHFGCTSSDIIDTATNLQIKQSVHLIILKMEKLLSTLKSKALATKSIVCLGRSHGMSAEPMSFATKFLSSYAEFERHLISLKRFYENEITGQFSGAVGNYTILKSEIEQKACDELELKVEPVSTQIIPRDRVSKLLSITALIASAIERISTEIRLLHHSDIAEVNEGFSDGQKGSSTMPHKKNPISAENLSGIARVIKSHFQVALEDNNLWHERDISHSSAERMILPDNLGLTFYAIKRLNSTIEDLVINETNIEAKVLKSTNFLSSYLLHKAISETDLSRDEIYPLVQKISFEANSLEEFIQLAKNTEEFKDINFKHVELMNIDSIRDVYLSEIDEVFKRVFNETA